MTVTHTKDILTLIERDHRKVDKLFQEVKNSDTQEYDKYFNQIDQELTLHIKAEELVFYPAMQKYEETEQYIEEAESEHNEIKILLEEMKQINSTDAEFESKMQDLIEDVQHHVKEEENEIFPAIRQCMKDEQLQQLGEEFLAAKAKLEPEAKVTAQ